MKSILIKGIAPKHCEFLQPNFDETTSRVKLSNHIKASIATKQGNVRKTMEDRVLVSKIRVKRKKFLIFAICDGHGSSQVAEFVQQHLTETLKHYLSKSNTSTKSAIYNTFKTLDEKVTHWNKSGTTVSLLLILNHPFTCWVANVGDSSVYGITKENHQVKLSTDHKTTIKKERERILASENHLITEDGYVISTDTNQALAMTRAVGDADLGRVILSKPNIHKLKTPFEFVVLSSDGIWDVVGIKQVTEVLRRGLQEQSNKKDFNASQYILNWRNTSYPQHDNTSMIIVEFDKTCWVDK